MVLPRACSLLVILALLAGACSTASETTRSIQSTPVEQKAPRVKTLTFAEEVEPQLILTRMGNRIPQALRDMAHQHLSIYNDQGEIVPQLAVELPSRNAGTWVIRPDGTMQTTYRIHRNVTWHDGTPLTARDFVFGWTVAMDSDLPIESRITAREIAGITTPDDYTLVIEWPKLYATANIIMHDDLGPLPVHLLKSIYETDKSQFTNSAFWNREFVGVGPYRLVHWEPGSHVNLEAYDGFYAGRAKIDRITLRFISSDDTRTAYYLAGEVDFGGVLTNEQKRQVQDEWERAGLKPTVIANPLGNSRHIWVQQRNPSDPALMDVRVRRGLLHALDRQALADALWVGEVSPAADIILFPPDDRRWEWTKDVAARYPYDLRRAEELFAQAGLQRGPDGGFLNAAGSRLVIHQMINPSTRNEQEMLIAADMWKTFGLQTEHMVLSRAQENDRQITSTFPGLYHTSLPRFNPDNYETRFHSAACPTQANGWAGQNHGCYRSPGLDRMIEGLKAAVEPDEQRPLYRSLVALTTEELPVLPLFFSSGGYTLIRPGITGAKGTPRPEGFITWNIAEWDVQ
jgi:peptide/nickel transport system substrate-binding protein